MKYLSNYIEGKQTAILNECGAFFAFSQKQLNEQKKEGVTYVLLGSSGLVCPKSNAQRLAEGLTRIASEGRKEDLAENGKKGVIHRELGNHEFSYTGDITDTVSALSGYGITEEEIQAETAAYLKEFYEWEAREEAKAIA